MLVNHICLGCESIFKIDNRVSNLRKRNYCKECLDKLDGHITNFNSGGLLYSNNHKGGKK